jgi:predicted peroxiredoxin
MSAEKNLVTVITNGPHSEKTSIAMTISNGGLTSGLKVSIFLTGDAVEMAKKSNYELVQFQPLDPLKELVQDFIKRGGTIWACTPCVKSRGLTESDLIEGVIISGSSVIHNLIKEGAATLSF